MLQWRESYNCHSATICKSVTLHVNWSTKRDENYKVSVLDRTLARNFTSLDEAKAAAIRLARKIANEMMEGLKDA